jgi:hypothetical protein
MSIERGKEEKELKCRICSRETNDDYCDLHMKAYENVVKNFGQWKKALEISWKGYLSEIAKNPLTGEWAREVAEDLARNGEK